MDRRRLGTVLQSPTKVRLWPGKFREPDVFFVLARHSARLLKQYCKGADLVMEVVSEGKEDRRRHVVTKRAEYARARIAEYWIVDPSEECVTVLRLAGKRYVVHGELRTGAVATSALLDGFAIDVAAVFAAGERPSKQTRRAGKRR